MKRLLQKFKEIYKKKEIPKVINSFVVYTTTVPYGSVKSSMILILKRAISVYKCSIKQLKK